MKLEEKIYAALLAEKARGPLTRDRWLAVAALTIEEDKQSRKRRPTGTVAPRERNVLFDTLATSTGTQDVTKLTRDAAKSVGVALADILAVEPALTTQEIERVVASYRKRHPLWPCTPFAIAKHWAEFAKTDPTQGAKTDVYQEPPNWKTSEKARLALRASPDTWKIVTERGWFDLGTDVRADILRGLNTP